MHFRILIMIATNGFLTAFECNKFVFGSVSARTPLGGLQCSEPPSWFKGNPTSKRKVREGRVRK